MKNAECLYFVNRSYFGLYMPKVSCSKEIDNNIEKTSETNNSEAIPISKCEAFTRNSA